MTKPIQLEQQGCDAPVRLHVGYVGITREGKRVEITEGTNTPDYPFMSSEYTSYCIGGNYWRDGDASSQDIVGPWVNPQVETPVEPPVDYNDGKWHRWAGGECPVHPYSVVEYVWHDENINVTGVQHRVAGYDGVQSRTNWKQVLKFRVTKEYVEPPKVPREFWIYSGITSDVKTEKPSDMYGYIHVREVLTDD